MARKTVGTDKAESNGKGAAAEQIRQSLATSAARMKDGDASPAGGSPATGSRPNREGIGFLGEVAWLMMMAPSHKHLFLADLEWLVVPPVAMRQFRLWRKDGIPVGYASWAFVNDDIHARFQQGVRRLAPSDWKSGEHAWLIDLIAPMGGAKEMLEETRSVVFKDKVLNLFQVRKPDL
ncbi:toxin-activating lysine-acyltransferase [Ferrovibrio sp.]|uniref:toxin-activating lysine-acyltransferase n=1 Tax=Ferrovibrio sp. TaxID=1917215 RepID=UPI0035ADA924